MLPLSDAPGVQFVDQTFKIAQSNLRVNGQNYETLDQNEQSWIHLFHLLTNSLILSQT